MLATDSYAHEKKVDNATINNFCYKMKRTSCLCISITRRRCEMDDQIVQFLWFILIGAVAGWLAGQITKGRGFGLIGNIIVGVLGALLGGWLFGVLGISAGGKLIGALITAVVGAIVLLFLLAIIRRK